MAAAIVLCLEGSVLGQSSIPQLERYEYTTPTMGTVLRMVIYSHDDKEAQRAIDAGLDEIERLIPILNNYDPSSEVSKLSQAASNPKSLSSDLAGTLLAAKRWHELSAGQFDITVGPLTRLWTRARKEKRLPDPNEIIEALQRIGWQNLRLLRTESRTKVEGQLSSPVQANLNENPLRLELLSRDMIIDVSGLATGYIIERAFEAITRSGNDSVLIDIGGDIRLGSPPPEAQGWTIEIAGIGKNSPPLCKRLLHSCAITTSGDLNQFIEIDGRRYSHLIDPITGIPLERRQSATVIAATAIDADAGATALCLLGMENASQQFDAMPLTEAYLMEVSKEDAAGSPTSDSSPSPTRHSVVRYRHLLPSPPTTP
ncbi:MAG: FAD:protein FMN transferase [Pirellula sp.]